MTRDDILKGLLARGVPLNAAIGATAGIGAESGFNPGINEVSPVVPGSRGGFGFNQWTGPRRRQYEAFAAETGRSVDDPEAQLDFTVWELNNTETAARDAIYAAKTPEEAISLYETKFLRPGIPHGGRGTRAIEGLSTGEVQLPPRGGQNALAGVQEPPETARQQLNPEAFMRQRNALAAVPLQFQRRNSLYV